VNYLGDWGTQVRTVIYTLYLGIFVDRPRSLFVIAHGFEKYGSQEELEKDAIKHLYQVYVKSTQKNGRRRP